MNFEIINPLTTKDLLSAVKTQKRKPFRFAAGCTDLLMELKKNPVDNLTVINLSQVKDSELTEIKKPANALQIGARVTAHNIVTNEEIKSDYPVLHDAALNLASTQIRQVATVGGNLCTASPSGDIACAFMALNAICEIINEHGNKRVIPIQQFFIGVRTTALKKGELLYTISIPANSQKTKRIFSGFIKVGTRKSMECSVVSLAYHIQTAAKGKIIHAGVAIGSVAPTIRLVDEASFFLKEKNIFSLTQNEKEAFAQMVLHYASPITDIRATAWYRKKALHNISIGMLENFVHEFA